MAGRDAFLAGRMPRKFYAEACQSHGRPRPDRAGSRPLTRAGHDTPSDALPRLMLVTDRLETGGRDLVDVVEAAVGGGVDLVQVRERDLMDAEVEALVGRILDRLRGTEARVVVNGRPAIAREMEPPAYVYATEPKNRNVKISWTDSKAKAGALNMYYVRLLQEDGKLAWASPMWIKYEPASG